QIAVRELRDVLIDVAVIEALAYFARENVIELGEIHEHARPCIDLAFDGHVTGVRVAVKARAGAETEDALVLLVAPFRATIAVRGGESDTACEICGRHPQKLMIFAGRRAACRAFETFLSRCFRRNPRGAARDRAPDVARAPQSRVEIFFQMLRLWIQGHCPVAKRETLGALFLEK